MLNDLRFALRQLRRTPGVAAIAMLSLGLAIGANSTIASVVNAVLLRPLPVPKPNELYIARSETGVEGQLSYPMIQRSAELLSGRGTICGQSSARSVQLTEASGSVAAVLPKSAQAQLVTGDCFVTLGQTAALGRLLTRDDDRVLNGHPVAVISDRFWAQAFNRSPATVGSAVLANGVPLTIVGVTRPAFIGTTVGAAPIDLWAPALMQPALGFAGNNTSLGGRGDEPFPPQREIWWLSVFVRIPGNPAAAADLLSQALQQELPAARNAATRTPDGRVPRVLLEPGAMGTSPFRERVRTQLLVLTGMAALLLALAAINIAGVLLARGVSRRRELTIRAAVGAPRRLLIRQMVIESLVVAIAGAALGLLLATRGGRALTTLMNRGTPFTTLDASPNWPIAAATFAVAVLIGVLAGIIGAWRSTRLTAGDVLRTSNSAGSSDHSMRRMSPGALLIAGQMALSVTLLVGAALAVRTLWAVTVIDLGFNPHHVVVARIDPRSGGYAPSALPALYARIAEALRRLPGVTDVSLSGGGPFGGSISSGTLVVEGYAPPRGEQARGVYERVTGAYVDTLGLQIVSGRNFTAADAVPGRRVSLVNESMAGKYFAGRPLGRRWGKGPDFERSGYEVVGVVRDAKYSDLKSTGTPMVYMLASSDTPPAYLASIEVAVGGGESEMPALIRRTLNALDPRLPIRTIEPLDRRIATAAAGERLLAELSTAIAVVAALLACLGLYGVLSYGVARRTAEIGVRMALGAPRGRVRRMVVGEALAVVIGGLMIGLPIAAALGRTMRSQLFGVGPDDPVAFVAGTAFLIVVALVAAYVPAYRAGALEPTAALRIQ